MKISKIYLFWLLLPLLFKEHATFEFLIESGTVSFISKMKMKELTLGISVDLTLLVMACYKSAHNIFGAK